MILEISCSHSSILRYLGIQQVVFGGRRMGDWEEGMTSTEDGYKSFKVWDRFNALTFLVSQLVHMRACWGSSQIKKESQLCRWDVICQVCSIEWSSLRIGRLCKVKLFFFMQNEPIHIMLLDLLYKLCIRNEGKLEISRICSPISSRALFGSLFKKAIHCFLSSSFFFCIFKDFL